MIDRSRLSAEDQAAFMVLDYQVSKVMDPTINEDVPERVERIDEATDTNPGDVPVGHKYMTDADGLFQLPSGLYVEVRWEFNEVPEQEADGRIVEAVRDRDDPC